MRTYRELCNYVGMLSLKEDQEDYTYHNLHRDLLAMDIESYYVLRELILKEFNENGHGLLGVEERRVQG